MNELGKTVINGKLRIVSPVHIGGAQEKHMQKGLDFIDTNEGIFLIDEKKLISHFGIDIFSNSLSQGKLAKLCNESGLNLKEYSTKVIRNVSGEVGSEIKTNIKNMVLRGVNR